MWSVCKQIAIFHVNFNLSASAGYQACWQHGAYLSCWQDEQGDREGEKRGRKDLSPLTNYTASKQLSPLFTFGQPGEAEMSIINQIFLLHTTNTHAPARTHTHTRALIRL